jgi:hypothetical protein
VVQNPEGFYPFRIPAGILFPLRVGKDHPVFRLLYFIVPYYPFHLPYKNQKIYTKLVGFCSWGEH